jgi:RNA polymerase sigma factor (sigma-70 family)
VPDRDDSTHIQNCIDRLRGGDRSALDELLTHASQRLARLTHKMLHDFPGGHRWEETDDVLQNATLRLCRALGEVHPATVADFFRLAAVQIRRELIDMCRHYAGPEGLGAHHGSRALPPGLSSEAAAGPQPVDTTHDPERVAAWTELHEKVDALAADEREAFDLLFYQGLSQAEAAEVLGVSVRTIKRRWVAARIHLGEALGGRCRGSDSYSWGLRRQANAMSPLRGWGGGVGMVFTRRFSILGLTPPG